MHVHSRAQGLHSQGSNNSRVDAPTDPKESSIASAQPYGGGDECRQPVNNRRPILKRLELKHRPPWLNRPCQDEVVNVCFPSPCLRPLSPKGAREPFLDTLPTTPVDTRGESQIE